MQWHKQSNVAVMSSLVLLLQSAHSLTIAQQSVVDEFGWPKISDNDMGRVTNELRRLAQAKALQGNTSMAIHIGPNDLDDYEVEAYKNIMQDAAWRVAFVEPQASKLEECRQKMDKNDALRGRLRFVNAAVCRKTGQEHFYTVSPRILEDIPCRGSRHCDVDAKHNFSEISSTSKEWIVDALSVIPSYKNLSPEVWDSYIIQNPISCITPKDLLAEIHAEARDVDRIIVDAEGYDVEIVRLFLQDESFAPMYLEFEPPLTGDDRDKLAAKNALVKQLQSRGYRIFKHINNIFATTAHI